MIGRIKYGIDWSVSRPGLRKERETRRGWKKEQGQKISGKKNRSEGGQRARTERN